MFITHSVIGILAGIFATSSYFFYIRAILQGKTKPHRITWILWSALSLIILSSYYYSGARDTIWVPIGETLGPIIVAILAFKMGTGGWSRLDKFCVTGVLLTVTVWWIFNSPLLALIASLCIDFFAAIPTIYKTFKDPNSEDTTAWICTATASVLNIFAIENFSFSIAVYPIYMITMNIVIVLLVSNKKRLFKIPFVHTSS